MQTQRTRGMRPAKITAVRGDKRRLRVQVWDPVAENFVSACDVLRMPRCTFGSKREANEIVRQAEALLGRRRDGNITTTMLRDRWLARTHHKGRKIKESTAVSNAERTSALISDDDFAHRPIGLITDEQARAFAAYAPSSQREAIKALFNYGVAEGLLAESPFRHVRVEKGTGNEEIDPPSEAQLEKLIGAARSMLPSWGDWLVFGSSVGTRPGETDGLRFSDFEEDFTLVRIRRQWNHKLKRMASPKHVHNHLIAVPPAARAVVKARLVEAQLSHGFDPEGYVFLNTRGDHWTQTSRAYYWKATKAAADVHTNENGEAVTPYLATRHYCGWYLVNVKGHSSEDVAHQLRHDDGGQLVRKLYGHRDRAVAARGILASFDEPERLAA
jgi:integrase